MQSGKEKQEIRNNNELTSVILAKQRLNPHKETKITMMFCSELMLGFCPGVKK